VLSYRLLLILNWILHSKVAAGALLLSLFGNEQDAEMALELWRRWETSAVSSQGDRLHLLLFERLPELYFSLGLFLGLYWSQTRKPSKVGLCFDQLAGSIPLQSKEFVFS
jgi:hypothetical protein